MQFVHLAIQIIIYVCRSNQIKNPSDLPELKYRYTSTRTYSTYILQLTRHVHVHVHCKVHKMQQASVSIFGLCMATSNQLAIYVHRKYIDTHFRAWKCL